MTLPLQAPEICQSHLGVAPWMDPLSARLPGLQPVAPGQWLQRDDAFSAQMAYRDRLIASRFNEDGATNDNVVSLKPHIEQAERDLLNAVLTAIEEDPLYSRRGNMMYRPDGVGVNLAAERPFIAAARLCQEDFLMLEKGPKENGEDGFVLTSGILCFPASWTLRQKVGRDLMGIHLPVDRYDPNMGARVDRVLNALQPGKAVWRANVLCYNDPNLYQPRLEIEKRPFDAGRPLWVRVERQSLMRLSPSGAIVFSIHTWLVPMERLAEDQLMSLPERVRNGGSMGESL
jgi:dimethylamine monooxygenase subunit A